MKKVNLYSLIALGLLSLPAAKSFGQDSTATRRSARSSMPATTTTPKVFGGRAQYTTWNIGINAGVLAPLIPFGVNDFTNKELNLGYGITIRKQLGHAFGLELEGVSGKLSGSNVNAVGGVRNGIRAFDTQLAYSATLSGVVNVATVDFIRRKNSVNFFVSAGGGLAAYAPKVTYANNTVIDWKDKANGGNDTYVHELVIPVGVGVKFRLSDKVALNLGYTANFIDGDNLDGNTQGYPTKDKFSYGYGGLEFALGGKSKPNLDWVNPAAMMYDELKDSTLRITVDSLKGKVSGVETSISDLKKDSDGDGVRDDLDKCPGTPAGTVVDGSGCEIKFPAPVVVAPPAPPAPVVIKKTVTKKYRVRTKKYHTVVKKKKAAAKK
ncbi:OmpA family protein [Mucilaginibacter arboris]|uniref:OmpA family protein n=1 Tax=Mucilaginibacter arboris TaxID=2682090 RepID=A0A7K1SSB1_9SPHI|nr:OmpA family protein [Mucilaginibacter arboris]MVN20134.1 OmpA family protein [Mucilaginibacter arboris]